MKVTVTFERQENEDSDVDLSWFDQTDAQMGDGFEAQSAERKAAYERGDWHMIGIRAVATISVRYPNGNTTEYTLKSAGLWGIESDRSEECLQDVYQEQCAELRADIEAMKGAEFK